jgi:hypothetical protein
MRKLLFIVILLLLIPSYALTKTNAYIAGSAGSVMTLDASNVDAAGDAESLNTTYTAYSQSWESGGGKLDSIEMNLWSNSALPLSGDIYVKVNDCTGTYGSSAVPDKVPTDAADATSDAYAASNITATTTALHTFAFSGANRITLTATNKYCLLVYWAASGGKTLKVGNNPPASSHAGNEGYFTAGTPGSWSAEANLDLLFKIYVDR